MKSPAKQQFSYNNPIKTLFLAVVLLLYRFYFKFILFAHTSQYLENDIFSFEKGSDGQSSFWSDSHQVIKKFPPAKYPIPPPWKIPLLLIAIWKTLYNV